MMIVILTMAKNPTAVSKPGSDSAVEKPVSDIWFEIPLDDAVRLLCNRMVELLELVAASGPLSKQAQYATVKLYLDGGVEWDTMHNFAIAHIDDFYEPEFQRPVEDLHLMFLPAVRNDAESMHEKPQIRYLLDVLELLKSDVEQYGLETVREREMQVMAGEEPSKHENRREFRNRHRRK